MHYNSNNDNRPYHTRPDHRRPYIPDHDQTMTIPYETDQGESSDMATLLEDAFGNVKLSRWAGVVGGPSYALYTTPL